MDIKRFIFAITFFLAATTTFAHTGIMWGERDIKYVSTEHFDIIYEPDCADSAALLYENAERILEEVQDFFGAGDIQIRLPVVISANCQRFNAQCVYIPYTFIDLFDTAVDESMAVFSDDLLSTFKHELTHAYTGNLKNKRIHNITKALGNIYNPGLITITSGMAESATLTSESSLGEGRLNDEWSRQVARQAKIENKWPKFWDEQGLATKYYAGDYYYLNGEFAKFLLETYGMEKYAEFWYSCINKRTLAKKRVRTLSKAFKTIYGCSVQSAWEKFEGNLFVPEYSEPLETDGIKDFFTNSNENYSLENNRGAIYQNLSATEDGLYYLDYKSANVYFVSNEKLNDNKKISPKKIFHKTGITGFTTSSDGRFIAYNYYNSNSANYKYCVGIYDTKTKHHIKAGERLKTPAIVKQGDDYYLLALNFISQKKQIAIKKIIFENDKPKKFGETKFIPLAEGTTVLSFTDIDNGNFAMILKCGMTWELCIGEISDDVNFTKIILPEEKMTMRYLFYSADDNSIYFSWTKPNSMPRLGRFSIDKSEFDLSDKNISGGVYYPAPLGNKIYYVGKFTKQNRIFSYENPLLEITSAEANLASKDLLKIPSDVTTLKNPVDEILADAKKYHPIVSYLHPMVIPVVSTVSSQNFDLRAGENFGVTSMFPFLGVTLVGLNTWVQGQTQISAGYGLETKSFGLSLSYQDGTDTSLFNYNVAGQAEFDFSGFKQASALGSFSIGQNWLSLSDKTEFYIGRSNYDSLLIDESTVPAFKNDNLFLFTNQLSVSAGLIQNYASELYNVIGGSLSVLLTNAFEKTITGNPFKYSSINLGTQLNLYIPRLLPINCYDRFVYNLPSKITLSAFTTSTEVFWGNFTTTLFGYDIQKGTRSVFFDKINIKCGYSFSFKYKDFKSAGNFEFKNIKNHFASISKGALPYTDMIFINANATIIPSFGMLGLPLTLTFGCGFKPNPLPTENKFTLLFDFELDL